MRIFIPEQQTVLLGTDFLRIRCLATLFMFMSFFTVYVFQGFGEGNKSLFLGAMRWAVFNIPMLFLLSYLISHLHSVIFCVILQPETYYVQDVHKGENE